MRPSALIFILACLIGLHSDAALGQGKVWQRMQNEIQERRERRQAAQLTDEGVKLYKSGKKAQASENFRRAVQLDPANDRAHAYLAQIAWEEQRVEIAKNHAEQALKINPHNARAHYVAGQILLKEGKNLAAFDHLRKASEKISDEQERREAGKLVAGLREKHPAWFVNAQKTAGPPATNKSASGATTQTASTTPPKMPASGVRPNLAVFTFDEMNPPQPAPGLGSSLAEMLTTALINSGSYRIIERKQLQKVLEEQALGQSGALESETAVIVGKIMSLDAVVVGSISALTSALEADARILNVETGEAITAAHSRAASADELRLIADALAKEISNRAAVIPVRAPIDTSASSMK